MEAYKIMIFFWFRFMISAIHIVCLYHINSLTAGISVGIHLLKYVLKAVI